MRLSVIFTVVFLVMAKCHSPKGNENEQRRLASNVLTFRSNYDTLQRLSLPLILNEKIWRELSRKHHETFGFRSADDILTVPFGKLVDSELFKVVIFIFDDPILVTIDRNQNPIDTLFLLGDNYSNDASTATIEQAIVNTDLSVQLIDSVFTYLIDENEYRIENSKKLEIQTENYRINKTGKILKVN